MGYYQTASLSNIDGFMQTIHNLLTSSTGGWSFLNVNTSSVSASIVNSVCTAVRETIYRCNGSGSDATRWYLSICRTKTNNNVIERVTFMPFAGIKNFSGSTVQVATTGAIRNSNSIVSVTCSAAHNLGVGDRFIINGFDNPNLNERWGSQANTPGDSNNAIACIVSGTSGTTAFSYLSNDSSVQTGSSAYVVGVYNAGSSRNGVQSGQGAVGGGVGIQLTDASMGLYMYYDESRLCGIVTQGGTFQSFYVGETGRDHVPSDHNGRAFFTGSSTGTGSQTVNLDRQIKMIMSQSVWLIHPSGSAGTGSFERVAINRINSSSFIATLTNNYPSGTLIGEDPLPVVVIGGVNESVATQTLAARTVRFIFHLDGTRNESDVTAQTMTAIVDGGIAVARINPDSAGYYQGKEIFMSKGTPSQGSRGRLIGMVAFPVGAQNDLDLMRTGAAAVTTDFKLFTSATADGTYSIGVGPGAS